MLKKKNKRKKNRVLKVLSSYKLAVTAFVFFASILFVIGSTYSWTSWTEWIKNHMQGDPLVEIAKKPSVKVVGDLDPITLIDSTPFDRQMAVTNNGEIPVFVRLDLEETLVSFKVDVTDRKGNAHLEEHETLEPGEKELISTDLATWEIGHFYKMPKKLTEAGNPYYVEAVSKDSYHYKMGGIDRPTAFDPIQLTLANTTEVPTGYWIYQEEPSGKGYYYYSEILDVGETTEPLLTNTTYSGNAMNSFKGSLHNIQGTGTGGQVDEGIFVEWQIPETVGNSVYDRFKILLAQ